MRSSPLLLLSPLLLAACARDTGSYPSLATRPSEKQGFAEPAPPPPVPVRADPALDARIADITARLMTVRTGFDADAARADGAARVARGRAVGSEAWLDAQVRLATLDDWRAQAGALASDAGDLATARAAELAPDYPTLTALLQASSAETARQTGIIDRIQATLPAAG